MSSEYEHNRKLERAAAAKSGTRPGFLRRKGLQLVLLVIALWLTWFCLRPKPEARSTATEQLDLSHGMGRVKSDDGSDRFLVRPPG